MINIPLTQVHMLFKLRLNTRSELQLHAYHELTHQQLSKEIRCQRVNRILFGTARNYCKCLALTRDLRFSSQPNAFQKAIESLVFAHILTALPKEVHIRGPGYVLTGSEYINSPIFEQSL